MLEHIEDDREEQEQARARLAPKGYLLVLAPAHNALYSPFDEAIGHYHRYTKRMLRAIAPGGLEAERMRYLDSAGQSMPTRAQVMLWDRYIVPVSKRLDPVIGYHLGKSVLGVWRKPSGYPRKVLNRLQEEA